jgi:putative membrane protein
MSGLFLGLVGGSALVATSLLQRRDLARLAIMGGSGLVFFALLGLVPGTDADDFSQSSTAPLWAFFASGAIAICAMILPGISGSFLLVIMGMYGAVLTAVNERDLVSLLVFALGAVLGLALFSQVLHWALTNHYDNMMAVLIGLMIGSLRVLWPWPDGLDSTALGPPDEAVAATVGLALFGLVVVLAINSVAKRMEHRKAADEAAELRQP